MCVSGLFGRNASGRGRTWHVHARRMNMAGCWTWVLEAHGEQGVQVKAHFTPVPELVSARGISMRYPSQIVSVQFCRGRTVRSERVWHQLLPTLSCLGIKCERLPVIAMQEAEQIAVGDGDEGCCCIKPVF